MPPFFSNGLANKRRAGPSCDGAWAADAVRIILETRMPDDTWFQLPAKPTGKNPATDGVGVGVQLNS